MCFIIAACKSGGGEERISPDVVNNPASAEGTKDTDMPEMEFETTRHDFGELKDGDVVEYSFNFTNTGQSDLVIATVLSSCGCTTPNYTKEPIKPGEKGKIDVQFNSTGKTGTVSKTISVKTNAVPSTRILIISAEVYPKE
ncbi:MAG: DUF1573 domain-containing protein [Bacteroidetes bacterium]|nr:DUF1573 domain-containing protein [Bacteroidota bacterium]